MLRSASNYDKLLEKATSHFLMEPDWPSILQICDLIRQNDIQPKAALDGLKNKLFSQDQHTALYALSVLESMVKNCGAPLHDEVTTRAFCDTLYELAKTTTHQNVYQKLLKLIQAWNFAFRNTPKQEALMHTMVLMKSEGFKFPALRESDDMFGADSAPDWAEGDVCHRCGTSFTLLQHKFHCRACGQIFCRECLPKTTTLPKFGIEKEVRVCDPCYDEATKSRIANKAAADKQESELPTGSAPDWAEGDVCHRCGISFNLRQLKFHCRACGQIFCRECLPNTSTLPEFGIEKEVRVCEPCYEQATKSSIANKAAADKRESELPPGPAPDWVDGDVCHCCRIAFTLLRRKFHCRACGQVFCRECMCKTTTLPKYGIDKEVRVCEPCYDQATKYSVASKAAAQDSELPAEYLTSSLGQQNEPPHSLW